MPPGSTPTYATASTTTRCSPCRARFHARSCRRSPMPPCRARMTAAPASPLRRRRAGLRHRLHGRGGRRAPALPRRRARPLGRAMPPRRRARGPRRARHLASGGLLSPVRSRALARAQPDRSGPRLVLSRGHRFHRLGGRPLGASRRQGRRGWGSREKLVAFMLDGPGIARQGNPVVGGGTVTSGTLSPCLDVGIGLAYVPPGALPRRYPHRVRTCAVPAPSPRSTPSHLLLKKA